MNKLFLIDDDVACLYMHKKNALKAGFQKEDIETFLNAEHALEKLNKIIAEDAKALWPQFICTDLNMPEMDAVEFLESLNKIKSHFEIPKITIATGSISDDSVRREILSKFDCQIKPKILQKNFFLTLLGEEE